MTEADRQLRRAQLRYLGMSLEERSDLRRDLGFVQIESKVLHCSTLWAMENGYESTLEQVAAGLWGL